MLLVTWNVNSLRARLPRVLELLSLHRPDVVCLQETKCSAEQFPVDELRDAGYAATHSSGGQWAGVAILARDGVSLTDASCILPGDVAPNEARWCEATVAFPAEDGNSSDGGGGDSGGDDGEHPREIRVISTYVPNGRTLDSPEYPRKLAFLDAMAARVGAINPTRAASGPPLILVGDMNICPTDLDVYDPAAFVGGTHVSEPERARLRAILAAGGLTDAYRVLHPDEVGYTWWDYRAGHFHKRLGLRIDLALVSETLTPRLTECGIDRNFRKGVKPSDHAPLLTRFA